MCHLEISALSAKPATHKALGNHDYWTRAWIVQEILLARKIWFLAQHHVISESDLRGLVTVRMNLDSAQKMIDLLDRTGIRPLPDIPVSRLLEDVEVFRQKKCSGVRDRIFSLLAVSADGPALDVDYNCPLPELARRVLRLHDSGICLFSVSTLIQALELDRRSSNIEMCAPLLAAQRSRKLHNISPCIQCGEDAGKTPEFISTAADTVYMCLHCAHSRHYKRPGLHQSYHNGHLCLTREASSLAFDSEPCLH